MTLSSLSPASPLAALIGRHRCGRTSAELAAASRGVIPASRWQQLETLPFAVQPALMPSDISAIAQALHLAPSTVLHYVLASRDLPVPAALTRSSA